MTPPDAPDLISGYSPHEHETLGSYTLLTGIFGTGFTGSLIAAYKVRGELPERYGVLDMIAVGLATHKLARLITKDKVTGFIRAPFVEYEEAAGQGEVSENPRGTGLRYATGELLICPYCVSQWIVGALAVGMVGAPRFTRLISFIYTAETVADFLQLAYVASKEAVSS